MTGGQGRPSGQGSVRVEDAEAKALRSVAAAHEWIAKQRQDVGHYLTGMRVARNLFQQAKDFRDLRTKHGELLEQMKELFGRYREFSMPSLTIPSRPLFDSGAAALEIMRGDVNDDDAVPGSRVSLKRERSTGADVKMVAWHPTSPNETPDATIANTDLDVFRKLTLFLDNVYEAQTGNKTEFQWGELTIRGGADPFRLEQLVRVVIDGMREILPLGKLKLREVPVIAVAAEIEGSEPVGDKPIETLREEIGLRADEWRQKPGLVETQSRNFMFVFAYDEHAGQTSTKDGIDDWLYEAEPERRFDEDGIERRCQSTDED